MKKVAVIRKCKAGDSEPEKDICLYTHDGSKLLGRHPSKESAEKQERAIQVSKHGFTQLKKLIAYLKLFVD